MGHKYSKNEILAVALTAALDDGLSQLTFGRLAKRIGTSDRVIVYYFPTKADLIGEVIVAMGLQLQQGLSEAFTAPVADHREMVRRAWPLLATPEVDRIFALFFEANGLATVGREPYVDLIPVLVNGWIEWASEFVEGPEPFKRSEAEAAVAIIDGLILLRLVSGPEAAGRAVEALKLT